MLARLSWRPELEHRSALLGIIDQFTFSASSAILAIAGARYLTASEFGEFATVSVCILISAGVSRAAVGESLAIRSDAGTLDDRTSAAGYAVPATISAVIGVILLALVHVLLLQLQVGMIALTLLATVAAAVAEHGRLESFNTTQAGLAFRGDLLWLALQITLLVIAIGQGYLTPELLLAIWAASALVAATYVLHRLGSRVLRRETYVWRAPLRRTSISLTWEFVCTAGATQLAFLIIGSMSGIQAVGAFRAVQVVFGPLSTLAVAVRSVLAPFLFERHRTDAGSGQFVRRGLILFVAVGAVSVIYVVIAVYASQFAAAPLFGDDLAGSITLVLLPYGAYRASNAVSVSVTVAMRAQGRVIESVLLRSVEAIGLLLASAAATYAWGIAGAAWAFAAVSIGVLAWALFAFFGLPTRVTVT